MNDVSKNKGPSGLSIAALVTGILSAMPIFGMGLSIAAIICGAIDLKKNKGVKEMTLGKGFYIAGIFLGSLSIVAGIVIIISISVAAVIFGSQNWEFWNIPIQSFM